MSVRVNKLLMSYKITIAEALERSALKPLVRKVQIYCCFLSDKKDKFIFFLNIKRNSCCDKNK